MKAMKALSLYQAQNGRDQERDEAEIKRISTSITNLLTKCEEQERDWRRKEERGGR